jgi:hypothetical protein
LGETSIAVREARLVAKIRADGIDNHTPGETFHDTPDRIECGNRGFWEPYPKPSIRRRQFNQEAGLKKRGLTMKSDSRTA